MIASMFLPLVLNTAAIEPVPARPAPVENRTEIALNYASQYIDLPHTDASSPTRNSGSCVIVARFGNFCTFKCNGVLALAECDSPPN